MNLIEIDECRMKSFKKTPDGKEQLFHLHESLWLHDCAICGAKKSNSKLEVAQDGLHMLFRSCLACKTKYNKRCSSLREVKEKYAIESQTSATDPQAG